MSELVVIARVEVRDMRHNRITLSRALWSQGLHIGDRLAIVEPDGGTMFATVQVSKEEEPVLRLPSSLDQHTRTVRVCRSIEVAA